MCVQKGIYRNEVKKTIDKFNQSGWNNCRNVKILGRTMMEWMCLICDLAWRQREVPDDWKDAIIVSLDNDKSSKDEYNNYRGISLLSVP